MFLKCYISRLGLPVLTTQRSNLSSKMEMRINSSSLKIKWKVNMKKENQIMDHPLMMNLASNRRSS
jgi:hypothetical protein